VSDVSGFASPQALAQEATRRAASGDVAGAEPLFARLVELAPQEPNAWAGLGRCRLAIGRTEDAVEPLRRAAALAPRNVAAAINLAGCLGRLGHHDAALAELDRAAALRPEDAAIAFNRARALEALERRDAAREAYDAALSLDPRLLSALVARAALLAGDGERLAAIGDLDLALAQRPGDARLRLRRARLALATGDWWSGLAEHELRLDQPDDGTAWRPALPLWRGEPLAGRHVLLFAEAEDEGAAISDTLQMLRFLPGLLARTGHVSIEVVAPLESWLSQSAMLPDGVRLVARGAPAVDADIAVALLGLPHLCEADPSTLPSVLPLRRRESQPNDAAPTIGIAPIADGPAALRRARSVRAEALAALSGIAGVRWVALQQSDLPWATDPTLVGRTDPQRMAAAIDGLDLIVAADNWIAHLAGTMGLRTAVLLDSAADWRWLDQRSDTPWYPTLRLYRQSRRGDWTAAVAALARDLPGINGAGSTAA
jgi:tetratricopeptide (TPR) repeat protein